MTLIDFNSYALSEAEHRLADHENVSFHLGALRDIGEAFPNAFDVVYCADILHHVSDLRGLMQSISRALGTHGVLLANAFAQPRYGEWDRLKYGYWRSIIRRTSGSMANSIYRWLWSAGRRWVRTRGLGRIAPLSESDLLDAVSGVLDAEIQQVGYYYFMRATIPRKDA